MDEGFVKSVIGLFTKSGAYQQSKIIEILGQYNLDAVQTFRLQIQRIIALIGKSNEPQQKAILSDRLYNVLSNENFVA